MDERYDKEQDRKPNLAAGVFVSAWVRVTWLTVAHYLIQQEFGLTHKRLHMFVVWNTIRGVPAARRV